MFKLVLRLHHPDAVRGRALLAEADGQAGDERRPGLAGGAEVDVHPVGALGHDGSRLRERHRRKCYNAERNQYRLPHN